MNSSNLAELERLVSELYDDGLSDADMARLEQLLLDNPELQDRYCSLVDTHVALCVAGASTVESDEPRTTLPAGVPAAHDRVARRPSLPGRLDRFQVKSWHAAAVAAALLVAVFSWNQWTNPQRPSGLDHAPPPHTNFWQSGVNSLPTITHVTWEGPSFTPDSDYWQPVSAVSGGAISLQQTQGEAADGYLFSLQPGMSVELVASCDATGQNSLSITEITYNTKPSTKKLTFHNKGDNDRPKPLHANPHAKNRRYGVLGRWSEVNTTDRPRYFLLTGVHKLVDPYPDDQWRVSEMGVLMETNSVIHVGWDDSGPAPPEPGKAYEQDQDYDDLAAYLFFAPLDEDVPIGTDNFEVLSRHQVSDLTIPTEGANGLDFELPSNGIAVVKAITDCKDPNALALVDTATGEILWAAASDEPGRSYLGTTAIRNTSKQTKRLRLVGMNIPRTDPTKWIPSTIQISYSQPNFFILGFEDAIKDDDFNDIRATLLIESPSSKQTATTSNQ